MSLAPSIRSIVVASRPSVAAWARSTSSLCRNSLDARRVPREPLPDVGVAGGQLQPALLPVRADDDRDPGLDRLRRVAHAIELVLRR